MIVDGICAVIAPFHEPFPGMINIVIEPKMSFGTGHHETTRLMIRQIVATGTEGMQVLDMGCGTGVLGIFALKRGAGHVTAIDIDEWAYTNSLENFKRNTGPDADYEIIHGDAASIPPMPVTT